MRFNNRFTLKDREGDQRIVQKFLFLPLTFENRKKTRWLEFSNVVQEVKKCDVGCRMELDAWLWVDIDFADKEDLIEEDFIEEDLIEEDLIDE